MCLKNIVKFLSGGRYQLGKDVVQTEEEKYENKKVFKHRLGGHRDGIDVTFEVYDSVHGFT